MNVTKISATTLSLYESCPHCFMLKSKGYVPPPDTLAAFDIGSAVHGAIASYHKKEKFEFKSRQTEELFKLYERRYPDPTFNGAPMDIEKQIEAKLIRPDYKRDLGITLTGIPDLLLRDRIFEHKTSSVDYTQHQVDHHFQVTAYAWLFYSNYRRIPKIYFNVFNKKKNELRILITERDMEKFLAWFDRVEFILNGIRNDWFFPSDSYWHMFKECPSYSLK